MADDAHDILARALADIVARLGDGVLDDRRKLTALLADTMPGHGRQIRLLGIAIDNGAVRAISRARLDQVELEVDRHAQRIDSDLGVRKAITLPVLRAVAFASGRGALPSMFAAFETTSPVRDDVELTPAEESWIGVSAQPMDAPPTRAPAPAPPPPPQPTPQPARYATPLQAAAPEASAASPGIAPQPAARPAPVGLGGWMILWVAWLLLGTIVAIDGTLTMYGPFIQVGAVAFQGLPFYLPFATPALAILGFVVLVLHVQRLRHARAVWCVWLLGGIALNLAYFPPERSLPVSAVSAAGIVYFLVSRRARNTFVR